MESQVGKCSYYQDGDCELEVLEWGYPYPCNGRSDCPDYKPIRKEENKMTIEERANAFAQQNNPTDYGDGKVQEIMANKYFAYRKGALDQKKIDIDKACEFLEKAIPPIIDIYDDIIDRDGLIEQLRKAMEEGEGC